MYNYEKIHEFINKTLYIRNSWIYHNVVYQYNFLIHYNKG